MQGQYIAHTINNFITTVFFSAVDDPMLQRTAYGNGIVERKLINLESLNAIYAGPPREIWGPGAKFDLGALEILSCSTTER